MTRKHFEQQLQAAVEQLDGSIEQLKNIIAEFDETETEVTKS